MGAVPLAKTVTGDGMVTSPLHVIHRQLSSSYLPNQLGRNCDLKQMRPEKVAWVVLSTSAIKLSCPLIPFFGL